MSRKYIYIIKNYFFFFYYSFIRIIFFTASNNCKHIFFHSFLYYMWLVIKTKKAPFVKMLKIVHSESFKKANHHPAAYLLRVVAYELLVLGYYLHYLHYRNWNLHIPGFVAVVHHYFHQAIEY